MQRNAAVHRYGFGSQDLSGQFALAAASRTRRRHANDRLYSDRKRVLALRWKRPLFVAWVVFSICWVLGWGWYYLPSCGEVHAGETAEIGWHCHGREGEDNEVVPALTMAAVIVGVPIALFFTALALRFLLHDRRSNQGHH